jgi:ketosteroid isomerase-like protein
MSASRRSVLAAAAASLASADVMTGATRVSALPRSDLVADQEVADLTKRSADAHAALMRGDLSGYLALITVADDFTLMAPFGGKPTRGSELSSERWAAVGRFFRNGTRAQLELVQSYRSTDMVVLAIIERAHVGVGGLPEQDWSLRVTLVYRREGAEWRLAHRHADPLVKGISLEQAAAIARP